MASTDAAKAQDAINAAQKNYEVSHAALAQALQSMNVDESIANKLIAHAEHYGLDHTKRLLMQNGGDTGLWEPIQGPQLTTTIEKLESTYQASLKLDEALADRNTMLKSNDPARYQVVMLGGREARYDPASEQFRDTLTQKTLRMEVVETADSSTKQQKNKKRDKDRDR